MAVADYGVSCDDYMFCILLVVLQGKGRKRKVKDAEDGKPPVYKWKRERLR